MITILALALVLLFYWSGITSSPTPHLEWVSGIQALSSITAFFYFSSWLKSRGKMREKISARSSPLLGKLEAPCRPFFIYALPIIALLSLIPPILSDTGYWDDLKSVISVHFVLIALFLDLYLLACKPGKVKSNIGEEPDLGKYKDGINGAIEAALKGVDSDSLTQAEKGLSLVPVSFSDRVDNLEYRALYLYDNLEVLAHRATQKALNPFVQETLGKVLRLSGNLLGQIASLATAGVETAGRIIRGEIHAGHLEAAEKGLFTFVQAVRGLKILPAGLGDYLIRIVVELEKGIEGLYKADKTRPVKSLLMPLAELKRTFQEERFVSHPEIILGTRELDRVIDLFKTLDIVLAGSKKAESPSEPTPTPE